MVQATAHKVDQNVKEIPLVFVRYSVSSLGLLFKPVSTCGIVRDRQLNLHCQT